MGKKRAKRGKGSIRKISDKAIRAKSEDSGALLENFGKNIVIAWTDIK